MNIHYPLAAFAADPTIQKIIRVPFVAVVDDVLAAEECAALIVRLEAAGFEPAPVGNQGLRRDVRNNDRVIFDDPGLAGRSRPAPRSAIRRPSRAPRRGAEPRFRAIATCPAEVRPHTDGASTVGELSSALTCPLLPQRHTGGDTAFLHWNVGRAAPRHGAAVRDPMARGLLVDSGKKYVLRSARHVPRRAHLELHLRADPHRLGQRRGAQLELRGVEVKRRRPHGGHRARPPRDRGPSPSRTVSCAARSSQGSSASTTRALLVGVDGQHPEGRAQLPRCAGAASPPTALPPGASARAARRRGAARHPEHQRRRPVGERPVPGVGHSRADPRVGPRRARAAALDNVERQAETLRQRSSTPPLCCAVPRRIPPPATRPRVRGGRGPRQGGVVRREGAAPSTPRAPRSSPRCRPRSPRARRAGLHTLARDVEAGPASSAAPLPRRAASPDTPDSAAPR